MHIAAEKQCFDGIINSGGGCGSVGRVVASKSRGPRFESSKIYILRVLSMKIKKKRPGMAHF